MSDNNFQMGRFSELVKQTLSSKKKAFVIMLVVVAILPLLVILMNIFLKSIDTEGIPTYMQFRFYRNVYAASAILAPYLFFFHINRSRKRNVEAMLHASTLENFLNMALFCFILVPLSSIIVYGASHTLFATVFPQYFYKFALIDLQYLFTGRLFIPSLILFMQITFFFNLFYSENKVRKTIITFGTVLLVYIVLVLYTDTFMMGIPVSLLILERFSVFLFVLLLYVLPVVLLICSYFIMKRERSLVDLATKENRIK